MPSTTTSAEISADGAYRYDLIRRWTDGPLVRWIMLNPSTADATTDDPTIRRCMGFAHAWGYSGILVHNLFALRATDPRELRDHPDPVGPENDAHLRDSGYVKNGIATVCAWGAHGSLHGRDLVVRRILRERPGMVPTPWPALCLGRTKAGQPRHPLYLPAAAERTHLDLEELSDAS